MRKMLSACLVMLLLLAGLPLSPGAGAEPMLPVASLRVQAEVHPDGWVKVTESFDLLPSGSAWQFDLADAVAPGGTGTPMTLSASLNGTALQPLRASGDEGWQVVIPPGAGGEQLSITYCLSASLEQRFVVFRDSDLLWLPGSVGLQSEIKVVPPPGWECSREAEAWVVFDPARAVSRSVGPLVILSLGDCGPLPAALSTAWLGWLGTPRPGRMVTWAGQGRDALAGALWRHWLVADEPPALAAGVNRLLTMAALTEAGLADWSEVERELARQFACHPLSVAETPLLAAFLIDRHLSAIGWDPITGGLPPYGRGLVPLLRHLIQANRPLGPEGLLESAREMGAAAETALRAVFGYPLFESLSALPPQLVGADLAWRLGGDCDGDGLADHLDPEPDGPGISLWLDGQLLRLDQPPRVANNRVLVPLRVIGEALDFAVTWHPEDSGVTIAGARTIRLWLGSYTAEVDGRLLMLDVAPTTYHQRTFVPVRFISETLDCQVVWNATHNRVEVYRHQAPPQERVQQLTAGLRPAPPGGCVYLTFDDGPAGKTTAAILDLLASEGVTATFFVIGRAAASQPELVRRVVGEGHALGNHSYSHDYKRIYASPEAYLAELERAGQLLRQIVGFTPRLTRAPGGSYGRFSAAYWAALKAAGYINVDWDISVGDSAWPRPSTDGILSNIVLAYQRFKNPPARLVVLLHDGGGDHDSTVRALPSVIQFFRDLGYSFAALGD